MGFYTCAFGDAPPRGRKSRLGESWTFACSDHHFRRREVCLCREGGIVFVVQSAAFSSSHLSLTAGLVRHPISGTCDYPHGYGFCWFASCLHSLPETFYFLHFGHTQGLGNSLLLGSGWLRLMGAYSMGVRSRHVRLSFSLAHEFFPQTAPIVGS